ncbi:MAG: sulfite exporter TauE/SafE family protein [Bacteroidota bacterium]
MPVSLSMSLETILLIAVGGVITGIIGGLFGVGGGIFLIPFLVLLFDVPMHQAIATSIVAVIATSSAAASVNVDRRFTNIRLGVLLETGTTAGAVLGGITANVLSEAVLSRLFGGLIFVVAILMARRLWQRAYSRTETGPSERGKLGASYFDPALNEEVRYRVSRIPAGLGVSFLAGNISGLLGIGGGIIKVPMMTLLCGLPMKAAAATSNFMIGVTALASVFIYYANGHVHAMLTGASVVGVLGGSLVGTYLSGKLHGKIITGLFVLILVTIAIRMVLAT